MKAIFSVLFLLTTLIYALPMGTTQDTYLEGGTIVGHAQPITLPHHDKQDKDIIQPQREQWVVIDSLHFDTMLPAGGFMSLQYNPISHTSSVYSNMGELISESITALEKSPTWVRPDLQNILSRLTSAKQLIWAGLINETMDPYIDEIAFSIAHSSVEYLSSSYANPQLMTENAAMIYQVDQDLQYVEVIDHGTSTTMDDYYTMTRYRKINADSTVSYVEVPRDIYYWYIVHPKITDEIPAYINPTVIESNTNHTNNITTPPTGQFWRSFFYTVQEDSLPVLSQMLANCQSLRNWNGTPGDAITTITDWINATLDFTSNTERPHQPVRIYKKHIGRCGEHADYTAAAARTALVPCTSIGAYSVDHTWNEFWDENWIHWEPVNHQINTPLDYENGWGWTFGTVFENRSDGFLTPITPRYSQGTATINILVVDSLQHPVDGARLLLMAEKDGSLSFDMQGVTGNDGICTFIVGENRHYAARADTPIGSTPSMTGTYLDITSSSVNGEVYDYQLMINSVMPTVNVSHVTPPATDPSYRVTVSMNAVKQVLCTTVIWDDITNAVGRPYIYKTVDVPGSGSFQLMDPDNFMFYQIDLVADAFESISNSTILNGTFNVPSDLEWYASIDNLNHIRNLQYWNGSLRLEQYTVANDDPAVTPVSFKLYPNMPNPFNPTTAIRFALPEASQVDLSVYNIRGQKVATLMHQRLEAGLHQTVWNGTNENGLELASGVYLYRLDTGKHCSVLKMILLK